jgi:membrane peptidoglycan carboxypeptidase
MVMYVEQGHAIAMSQERKGPGNEAGPATPDGAHAGSSFTPYTYIYSVINPEGGHTVNPRKKKEVTWSTQKKKQVTWSTRKRKGKSVFKRI